jgi:hypothetical protein
MMTVAACAEVQEVGRLFSGDITPPAFGGVSMESPREIVVRFSEEAILPAESVALSPELPLESVRTEAEDVRITLAEDTVPGVEYVVHAIAEDSEGNRLSFLTRVYGYNPDVPELLINEFTTQGSGNNPDIIELYTLSSGNLGGVTVYAGSTSDFDSRITLPALPVEAGAYLLIHFKPEGLVEEIDELEEIDVSGGLNASDTARDFWVPDGTGLSGNNGALTVYAAPGGALLDAVVYSNRTSDSDENYGGFGSKGAYTQATEVAEQGGWHVAGESIAPEDAIDPEDSTGTRTVNRTPGAPDTDSAGDWHIGPTSSASFGASNTVERYIPDG